MQSKFALKLCNQIVEKRENGMTQQPSQDNLPNIKKESESKMMICLQSFSVVWSTSFCCLVWPSSSSSLIHLHLRVFFLIDEELIRFGWEEDVWFHVDNLSSAHVYLRLQPGQSWDFIPEDLLHECCQLVKANSIEGLYLSFFFLKKNTQ